MRYATISTNESHTIKLPGATIYYEIQGSGPMLVMIPGGPTDAGVFAGLARSLADRYTVVAYDPRGISRSTLDGAPENQQVDLHGDDAARLIEALGAESAYVLGSSGGAQIGLNLAARHPERVRTLIAHEPPCVTLLPDASEAVAGIEEIYATYRREGAGPGMRKFTEFVGSGGGRQRQDKPPRAEPTSELGHELGQMFARIGGNLDYFLGHMLRPISFYLPDLDALRAFPDKVVLGIGQDSGGQRACRSGIALAQKLEIEPVVFPGDHGGYIAHPDSFADALQGVLRRGGPAE
jgi:pimeloyl-ACP methyl ester carboxylesterase